MITYKSVRLQVLLAVVAAMALVDGAQASLVISLSQVPPGQYFPSLSSTTGASDVAGALGIPVAQVGTLLYKINSDGSEAGTLQSSYTASPGSWNQNSSFPITISYSGAGQIASPATYLLVKDGNLGSYIFDLGASGLNWDGVSDILVYNLFAPSKPDPSGTSHIEFFGAAGALTPVPEPGTVIAGVLLLLPLGVGVLRVLRCNGFMAI
jgi:hypothetical protein